MRSTLLRASKCMKISPLVQIHGKQKVFFGYVPYVCLLGFGFSPTDARILMEEVG